MLLIGLLTLIPFYSFNTKENLSSEKKLKPFGKKRITRSFTLSGGCTVAYDVTISYTIIPPSITGISGTVSFSGNCTGSQSIEASATVDGNKIVQDFTVTNAKGNSILISNELKQKFIQILNAQNLFR